MNNSFQILSNLIQIKSNCNELIASKLTKIFIIKELKKDDYFFKAGNKNKYIGFVIRGVLRLFTLDEKGNENNLFFTIENDFVIGNLTPNMKYSFNAQALTDLVLLKADFADYYNLLTKNEQLSLFHEKILGDIHNKLKERITKDFFSDSAKNYQTFLNHYPGLLNRIPHHYIASYLGITPTQLSRVRKKISG